MIELSAPKNDRMGVIRHMYAKYGTYISIGNIIDDYKLPCLMDDEEENDEGCADCVSACEHCCLEVMEGALDTSDDKALQRCENCNSPCKAVRILEEVEI